ncbi:MAG: hypothetical protein ACK4UY_16765, partial [Dietzia sp.]
ALLLVLLESHVRCARRCCRRRRCRAYALAAAFAPQMPVSCFDADWLGRPMPLMSTDGRPSGGMVERQVSALAMLQWLTYKGKMNAGGGGGSGSGSGGGRGRLLPPRDVSRHILWRAGRVRWVRRLSETPLTFRTVFECCSGAWPRASAASAASR